MGCGASTDDSSKHQHRRRKSTYHDDDDDEDETPQTVLEGSTNPSPKPRAKFLLPLSLDLTNYWAYLATLGLDPRDDPDGPQPPPLEGSVSTNEASQLPSWSQNASILSDGSVIIPDEMMLRSVHEDDDDDDVTPSSTPPISLSCLTPDGFSATSPQGGTPTHMFSSPTIPLYLARRRRRDSSVKAHVDEACPSPRPGRAKKKSSRSSLPTSPAAVLRKN